MSRIVPCRCSYCGVEFELHQGGVCSECRRFFCYNHLRRSAAALTGAVCVDCGRGDPTLRPVGAWLDRLGLKLREILTGGFGRGRNGRPPS